MPPQIRLFGSASRRLGSDGSGFVHGCACALSRYCLPGAKRCRRNHRAMGQQRPAFGSRLLDRATALGRIFVSQDEDMLAAAALRQAQGRPFAGLIYAHQQRITI